MNTFGLTKSEYDELINILKPAFALGKAWVFGSRARGDHKKFSDIDILFEKKPTPPTLSLITESLEKSNLPIKVDIVFVEELNQAYKAQIDSEKIILS